MRLDARTPVRLLPPGAGAAERARAARPGAVVLAEAGAEGAEPAARFAPGPHAAACACCAGRAPAALALDRLFLERVRGTRPWFDAVLAVTATPAGAAAVRDALAGDAVVAARYRLEGG